MKPLAYITSRQLTGAYRTRPIKGKALNLCTLNIAIKRGDYEQVEFLLKCGRPITRTTLKYAGDSIMHKIA